MQTYESNSSVKDEASKLGTSSSIAVYGGMHPQFFLRKVGTNHIIEK